jgi:hypothetical protein
MKRAWNLTRKETFYRHEMFSNGLRALGYTIQTTPPQDFGPDDLLLIWNRYGASLKIADAIEAAGGRVIVAENGYIGMGGQSPHSMTERDPYALALGWHNDHSVIRVGNESRWEKLGIELQPLQDNHGGHVLICPNRPFGAPGRAMPMTWAADAAMQIRQHMSNPIRIRPHPGNNKPLKPLAEDLKGAARCVIWSSSAGVHALIAGLSVSSHAPFWICHGDENTVMSREKLLERMAYGQWFCREIESGKAFEWMLNGESK